DYDASVFQVLWNRAEPYGHSLTEEAQITGSVFDNRLKFATGVFYYNLHSNDTAENQALAVITGANSRNFLIAPHHDESVGPYAQPHFSIPPQLRLPGGVRHSSESKDVAITQFQSRAAPAPFACTVPFPNAACVNTASNSYSATDYTAGFDYDVRPDVLVYT